MPIKLTSLHRIARKHVIVTKRLSDLYIHSCHILKIKYQNITGEVQKRKYTYHQMKFHLMFFQKMILHRHYLLLRVFCLLQPTRASILEVGRTICAPEFQAPYVKQAIPIRSHLNAQFARLSPHTFVILYSLLHLDILMRSHLKPLPGTRFPLDVSTNCLLEQQILTGFQNLLQQHLYCLSKSLFQ